MYRKMVGGSQRRRKLNKNKYSKLLRYCLSNNMQKWNILQLLEMASYSEVSLAQKQELGIQVKKVMVADWLVDYVNGIGNITVHTSLVPRLHSHITSPFRRMR